MGTIDHLTPMWHLSVFMVLMGLGTGALMQNLVLVVQNTVDVTDVGAASGMVSFFRSLGGTIGVAALGARARHQRGRQDRLGPGSGRDPRVRRRRRGSLDLDKLPPAVATIVRTSYADATGQIFLIAGLIAIVTFVAVWLMPVTELRTTIRKVEETRTRSRRGPARRARRRAHASSRGRPGLTPTRRRKAPVRGRGPSLLEARVRGQPRKPTCPVTLVEMST